MPIIPSIRAFVTPLGLIMLGGVFMLFGIYNLPLALARADAAPPSAEVALPGAGQQELRLPNTGTGQFHLRMRLAPGRSSVPLTLRMTTPSRQLSLGAFTDARTYHLLLPSTRRGDVYLALQAASASAPDEPSALAVSGFEVRSLGMRLPPARILFNLPATLLSAWLLLYQLRWPKWGKLLLLAGLAALLCLQYALLRGQFIRLLWLPAALALIAALVVRIGRFADPALAWSRYQIVMIFVLWRGLLWLVATVSLAYADEFYALGVRLSYGGGIADPRDLVENILVRGWAYWDGVHYQAIATTGYTLYTGEWPTIAFFPLYPLLIRLLLPLVGNAAVAGLLIANGAFLLTLWLLHRLLEQDFGRPTANRTLVVLLLFPTSFFFAAVYSESLSLALAVAVLWALRRQQWWLAGAAGFFLTLTRLPGVMIAPLIGVAYLSQQCWRWRAIRPDILACLLPVAGLSMFMLFQWLRFGTPFAFMIAQRAWDQRISPPWVIPKVLLEQFVTPIGNPPFILGLHLGTWLLFLILIGVALRRLPWQYAMLGLLLLLPPYLGSWSTSIARHVLLGAPAFVVLAGCTERSRARWLILGALALLLVICTSLFVNGFWVA